MNVTSQAVVPVSAESNAGGVLPEIDKLGQNEIAGFEIDAWNNVDPDKDDTAVALRTQMVVQEIIRLLLVYLNFKAGNEHLIKDQRVVPLAREIVKVFKKFNLHLADENDYVQVAVDSFLEKNLDDNGVDAYKSKELYKVSETLSRFSSLDQVRNFFEGPDVAFYEDPKFPLAIVLMKIIDVAKFSAEDDKGIGLKETLRRVKKLKYLSVLFAKTKHIHDKEKKFLCDMIDGLMVGGRCKYPKASTENTVTRFVSRKLARAVIQHVTTFFVKYIKNVRTGSEDSGFDDRAVQKLQEVVNTYFNRVNFDYMNRKDMKTEMFKVKKGGVVKNLEDDLKDLNPKFASKMRGGVFRGQQTSVMKGAMKKGNETRILSKLEKGWETEKHKKGQVVQRLSAIQQELKKDKVIEEIGKTLEFSNKYQFDHIMKQLGNTGYTFNHLIRGNRASPSKIADNFVKMFGENRKNSSFLSDTTLSYNPKETADHLDLEKSKTKIMDMLGDDEFHRQDMIEDKSEKKTLTYVPKLP